METPKPLLETLDPYIAALPDMSRMPIEQVKAQYGLEKVYRLSSNESAYGPSPRVVAALQAEAPHVGLYPSMTDDPLRQALVDTIGRGLSTDHFFTGSSGYETLELTARAFLKKGDEVIVTHPTFPVYDRVVLLQGGTVVDVPLQMPNFSVDVDGILGAVTDHTRMVILCNPNNPTGTLMPQAQMDRLVSEMPDHVLIVADEVYFHFVTDPEYPDSIQYILDQKNVVIIHTFSKGYGLAGMRLGYGISTPEIAHYIRRFHRGFHQNRLQIVAGIEALADQQHLQKNIDAVLEGRKYIQEEFDRLDLLYWPSQGNFILVQVPYPAGRIADDLLKSGIMVRPMGGSLGESLRVSIGTREANEAFIMSFEQALLSLAKV